MDDNKVIQSNLFALILLILYATAPTILVPIFKMAKLSQTTYIVLPQLLLLIVPTIIFFIVTKRPVKETLRLNKIGISTIVVIIGVGFLAQPIAAFLSLITQFVFPNRISQVVVSMNELPFIIKLGVIALTPAICEEITMRGVVLSGYNNIGMRKTAIMTGMFFGMLHLDGNQLLYAFAIGIVFAYLVRITNSIYSSMICHFVINGSQVVILEISSKLMKLAGQEIQLTQQAGISALTTTQLINTFFALLTVAIICIGLIIVLMQKLIKIHGVKDLDNVSRGVNVTEEDIVESKELQSKSKVFNWPVYVYIVVYVIVIGLELKEIYLK